MLQQQMMQQTFQGMQQALSEMTPERSAEMRQMMQELNEMLEAAPAGEDPNFEQFMHHWGHFFGPDHQVARRPDRAHAAQMARHAAAHGEHVRRATQRAAGS